MRNFYHVLIGFSIVYTIGVLTGFQSYTLEGKIIGVPLISIIIGGILGFLWEAKQSY
jgi:hypothetical protein